MNKTICFDIDGTIINLDDTPRYEVIQLFHIFESLGWKMYIWSGGGIDYATRWRDKLGLKAEVIEKGSIKPDIAVDDNEVTLGIINIQTPPSLE